MPLGHDQFPTDDMLRQHFLQSWRQGNVRSGREVIDVGIYPILNMLDVGLLERTPIENYLLVLKTDMITRNADHALDIILLDVRRIPEHNDVAALHILVGQQVLTDRPRRRVSQLIYKQVVAN